MLICARSALRAYHKAFHPLWGQLLKTGYQNSRFAYQTERFACHGARYSWATSPRIASQPLLFGVDVEKMKTNLGRKRAHYLMPISNLLCTLRESSTEINAKELGKST